MWLLECSHDSGRCHATMFFGLSFHFQVILNEFDEADGLRKMYNVVSIFDVFTLILLCFLFLMILIDTDLVNCFRFAVEHTSHTCIGRNQQK